MFQFRQDVHRGLCVSWIVYVRVSTFAISLQLFPASRIVLSLCSSAGVHGVLVRLFFALGSWTGDSTSVDWAAAAPPDEAPTGVAELAIWSCARLTDFRFLELPGVLG